MSGRLKIKQENEDGIPARRPHKRPRSWLGFLLDAALRLSVWYTIITIIFFCPSSSKHLTNQSPRVCKPSLLAHEIAVPYLEPYYHTYAAHHVDRVRPYIDTVRVKAYEPGLKHARNIYTQYAAPRVSELSIYSQAQWDKTVKPRLDELKVQATTQYSATLAPYVDKLYEAVEPYLQQTSAAAKRQYHLVILPAYEKAIPYGQIAYQQSSRFATNVVFPHVKIGSQVVYSFLAKKIWPPLRVLYGENVQPQLVKIQERLISYREGKRVESAMYEAESSLRKTEETTETSATAFTDAVSTALESVTAAIKPKATEPATTQSLKDDLNSWKIKFTKAADKGAEDLKQRVDDIVIGQISSQVDGTGKALLAQLEDTSTTSVQKLHRQIKSIVNALPDEVYEDDEVPAVEDAQAKIRSAGKHVKEAAQKVRAWKQMFIAETDSLVKDAADSTLDVIDHIRDLGLQDIGMRWARHDDTSYKDWSEYHSLKKTFDKWHTKIEDAAYRHKALEEAKRAAEDVEAEGMALAEDTAKELMRLKDVAHWKIRARDTSDDFDSRVLPAALVRIQEAVQDAVEDAYNGASEAILGSTQEPSASAASVIADSVAAAKEAATSVASDASVVASEAVVDPVASAADAVSSGVSQPASNVAENASSAAASIGKASAAAISAASSVVERVKGDAYGSSSSEGLEGQASSALDSVSSVIEKASSSILPEAEKSRPATSSIADAISEASAGASRAASGVNEGLKDQVNGATEYLSGSASSINSRVKDTVGLEDPVTPGVSSAISSIASNVSQAASKSNKSAASAFSSASIQASKASLEASASVAPSAASAAQAANDFVSDRVDAASASIASAVSKAGSDYSSVTEKLAKAAAKAVGHDDDDEL